MDDQRLLERFTRDGSQDAFRELTVRHTNLVYGCAVQRLRDAHAAQDVTQAVFLALALKAQKLRTGAPLPGWLFKATRFACAMHQRGEQRRKEREMRVFEESQITDSGTATEAAWEHMQPHLAGALDSLSGTDREAVLLRFYRKASHQEVATALGTSEDGARKRVDRALNKLRRFITNKGVALSATALAGALTANAAPTAPAGLAATAGATALAGAGGTLTATSTLVLAKGAIQMMFWSSVKTAAVMTAAMVVMAGGGAIIAQEARKAAEQPSASVPAAVQAPVSASAVHGDAVNDRQQATVRIRLVRAATGEPAQKVEQWAVDAVRRLPFETRLGERPPAHVEAATGWATMSWTGKTDLAVGDASSVTAELKRRSEGLTIKWVAIFGNAVGEGSVELVAAADVRKAQKIAVDLYLVAEVLAAESVVSWGVATNELQAGLVPLGGVKGWKRFLFLCPNHSEGTKPQPPHPSITARNRFCMLCGAPKPWSATFVEGEPMRMELHVRNLAKEARTLWNAGVRSSAPDVCRYWEFTFTPASGGTPWKACWSVKPHVPPESDLTLGVGDQNETAVELHVGGEHWIFEDRQGRRINTLPPGKYTVTASYAHPEHKQARAPIPVSPAASAEIEARYAARPGGEDPAAKPFPYWHGTVTTGPVEIEIKADDAEARFLEAAKYAGFAAVAEVKALPQAGDKTKPAQLGIAWKELLYAPEIARNELSDVRALELKDGQTTDKLQPGDRILVTVDQQQVMILALSKRLDKSSVNGAKWISWSQNRQDALQAALAPGWRKGACPWCHRSADPDYLVCACRNGCEGQGCTQRQKQRGECLGDKCKRTIGPATPGVTFRLWAYDPTVPWAASPPNPWRIQAGTVFLPLWVEVQNEKGETPEFQTPVGGAGFDYCKTLFYLVEGPGLTAPTPAFHADADGGALANIRGAAALKKGSACGQVQLVTGDLFGKPIVSTPMGEGTKIVQPVVGKLFATPGTYTVRAVAGRLVSNPVKVEVCVGAFLSLQGESMRKELTNEEAHQLAVRLANEKFAKKAFIDPMTGNKMPSMSIDLPPGEKTNNRWLFLRSAPAGIFAKVSFDLDGSNPVVEVDYARE